MFLCVRGDSSVNVIYAVLIETKGGCQWPWAVGVNSARDTHMIMSTVPAEIPVSSLGHAYLLLKIIACSGLYI